MEFKNTQDYNNEMLLKLDSFDGPLDVLYELVKDKRLDIFKLDIVELTNQYLDFVNINLKTKKIDELSTYLVMASYLIELKTKMLLPSLYDSSEILDNELEIDKLRQQIFLYKQYKEVISEFRARQNKRFINLSKESDDMDEYIPDIIPEAPLPTSIDVDRLVKIWKKILVRTNVSEERPLVITVNDINVEEIQEDVTEYISEDDFVEILFSDYILKLDTDNLNLEFICGVFLSLLVLVKESKIILIQKDDDFIIKKKI